MAEGQWPGISLSPPKQEGGISLDPGVRLPKDEEVLRSRIQKADYALGADSPGQHELSQSFWLGLEDRVRQQAALSEAIESRRNWQRMSQDIVRNANREGRPLTDEESQFVLNRPAEEPPAPEVALEKRYADRLVQEVEPEQDEVTEESRSIVTKQQVAQRLFEGVKQQYDDTSWGAWAGDFAKGIIPIYSWAKSFNRLEGVRTSSVLQGSNIAEQMRGLYLLPAEEFEATLKQAVDELAQENIVEAVNFAQAAVAFSTSDQIWGDVFSGLDTADVASLGVAGALGAAAKGAKLTKAAKMRSVVSESMNPKMSGVDRKVLAGETEDAAREGAKDRLASLTVAESPNAKGGFNDTRPSRVLNDLRNVTPSLMDPESYLRSAGSLTNERQRRLLDALADNEKILKSSLDDVTHITRLSDEAADLGFREAEASFRRTYFRLEDSIVDVIPERESAKVFGGTDHIKVLLGDKDAAGFTSQKQAEFWAKNMYRLPDGAWDVEVKGGSFFVRMEKSIDETSNGVLDLRLSTNNQAPENFVNTWIGWLRNPDDVRSIQNSALAKQATYGGNAVMSKMSEVAKSIGRLGKNESERLNTIISESRFKKRDVVDPATGETTKVTGRFYHTVADLEKAYMDRGFNLPSDKEIEGYFAFRQLMDYDYAVRNLSVYRDKARLGIDQKSVGWIMTDDAGKKMYKNSEFFEGRTLTELPSQSGSPFTVAWYDGDAGKARFSVSNKMFGKDWKAIEELLQKDYKIIQVANPSDEGVRKMVNSGGEPVQYMIVRDVKEKPLSGVQVPWNEGGHWIYPQTGTYLKQPQSHKTKFGRRVYDGDVTAHYFVSSKQGQAMQKAYETARQMLKNEDPNLGAFLADNLPHDEKKFRKLFRETGSKDAPFSLDHPFVLTNSGQRSSDVTDLRNVFNEEFVDASRSEHSLLAKLNTQYAQERGERLTTIKNTGTEANPILKLSGAPLMDPMEALSRSTAQLARSRFFDDYKHSVVEDFVTQFADTMDVPMREFRADPMRYINDPKWLDSADAQKLAAAKNNRRALLYVLGQDNAEMKAMKWTRQKIVDGLYSGTGKDSKILDPFRWDSRTDPITIARSAVFHLKLGMLNVVQYPLQAQAVLHAAAVDGNPVRAARANYLYWSMRMRGLAQSNAKAQSLFGRATAKALGIDQSVVDEMYTAFRNSGMDIIEGEYARLDDYLNPRQLFGGNAAHKGLDAAAVAFKEGNLTHRGVSFATSFLRWREANPLKKLDSRAMREIVERADLYYINMSRASNTPSLAEGVQSIPTQFFTFHKNLMEQLLGKRLSPVEKARVMTMYSAIYGVPVGAGVAVAPLWPVQDSVRQYTLENGIDTDENTMTKFLMDGAGQVALEMLTGEDFNFAERYGPGGLSWLRDLLNGDTFDVVSGASGSTLASSYERMAPFGRAIVSVFTPGDDYYPIGKAEVLDALREISSVNNAARAYYAVNAGQFLTKGDQPIMDIEADAMDAIMIGVFGMSPQEVSETYIKLRSMREEDDAKAALSKEVLKQFTRGAKASANGERQLAREFYTKAHALMAGANLTPQERADLFKRAVRQNQPLLEKVDRDFMMRDPEVRHPAHQERTQ